MCDNPPLILHLYWLMLTFTTGINSSFLIKYLWLSLVVIEILCSNVVLPSPLRKDQHKAILHVEVPGYWVVLVNANIYSWDQVYLFNHTYVLIIGSYWYNLHQRGTFFPPSENSNIQECWKLTYNGIAILIIYPPRHPYLLCISHIRIPQYTVT